jgi:hypothetical protein
MSWRGRVIRSGFVLAVLASDGALAQPAQPAQPAPGSDTPQSPPGAESAPPPAEAPVPEQAPEDAEVAAPEPEQAPPKDLPAQAAEPEAPQAASEAPLAAEDPAPELPAEPDTPATVPQQMTLAGREPIAESESAQADKSKLEFDPTTGRYMARGELLPWRNSFFIWSHGLTTNTLASDSQLTHNPTYYQQFSLRPRWNFTDTLSLRLRQDLWIELTDSETTVSRQEPELFDTTLSLIDVNVLEVAGIALGGGPQLIFPLSPASRAAERIMGTAAIVAATRSFQGVLQGLALQLSGSYTHFWGGSNVATTATSYPCQIAEPLTTGIACSQTAGFSTVRDWFIATLAAQLVVLPGFSVNTDFTYWWQLAHGLAEGTTDTLAGPVVVGDGSATHFRNLTWWTLSASYQFFDWMEASIGLSTLTSQRNPDQSRRNPFINPDTELRLSALVLLDRLYMVARAQGGGQAAR